ncbi:flagellar biosynthesis protein FlhF [Lysobacter koreensis]|uniref:Flagellar biosynthesis protein FlhF n=1 Tax=Lysobacter koreensis TaxID=266122 RepID=A0ABW2YLL2_9GAMM
MRIKRFIAPDMRTALRMVRDEQGPDAVILSNRAIDGGGIEVVAATDYDEALVAQALRAAAPGLETAFAPNAAKPPMAIAAPAIATAASPAPAAAVPAFASLLLEAAPEPTHFISTPATPVPAAASSEPRPPAAIAPVAAATDSRPAPSATATATAMAAPARESLMARARAAFKGHDARGGDGPTLAELSAGVSAVPAASSATTPAATRFEEMMAALNGPTTAIGATSTTAIVDVAPAATTAVETTTVQAIAPAPIAAVEIAAIATSANPVTDTGQTTPAIAIEPTIATASTAATVPNADDGDSDADYLISLSSGASPAPAATADASRASEMPTTHDALVPAPTRALRAVVAAPSATPDANMLAMRDELASMRQLMEKQMEQLSLERLRGSPGRAAAYDALIGYGCEETLAQSVAAKLDPRLPAAEIFEPMFAELARTLSVARSEPLDDGGVIALVGPTGAGKTTTAAKLAARFAARHRARDVALLTTDGKRAGAHEQLHAHGRRLGITVCAAAGPEGLADALAQLTDYPLVLVDTTGYAPRDRALFSQILWLRAARKVRSLLVLPANAHPHDLGEVIRRYRPAAPEGVVLTKLDETGRLGSALSVTVRHGLTLAYTTHGQETSDLDTADATHLARTLEKLRRAADNPLATEDRHAVA